jgi:hypothetical protein
MRMTLRRREHILPLLIVAGVVGQGMLMCHDSEGGTGSAYFVAASVLTSLGFVSGVWVLVALATKPKAGAPTARTQSPED